MVLRKGMKMAKFKKTKLTVQEVVAIISKVAPNVKSAAIADAISGHGIETTDFQVRGIKTWLD